jgi:hypothetical protein
MDRVRASDLRKLGVLPRPDAERAGGCGATGLEGVKKTGSGSTTVISVLFNTVTQSVLDIIKTASRVEQVRRLDFIFVPKKSINYLLKEISLTDNDFLYQFKIQAFKFQGQLYSYILYLS